MSSFKLIVKIRGNDETVLSEHIFDKEQISIGRVIGNDLVLPDMEKKVSSHHARINQGPGGRVLVDLGSTNGTFLNDKKLKPNSATAVKNGDQILVGGLYLLRFIGAEERPEKTVVVIDPSQRSTEIAEELPLLWARHAGDTPVARRKAVRDFLQAEIGDVPAETARAILSQLKARFHVRGGVLPEGRTTDVRRQDQEIQRREELYQAGLKAVGELSGRFVGPQAFETAEQVERFWKLLHQMIELTLDWISKSLKGRKEFEGQFSADLTMVFGQKVNPIKQGGPEEIARFLLDWRSPRQAELIREALDGAFKDLTLHQIGLLAGVQESLGAVLRRLDPKVVENEAKEKGAGGMFASAEKRAWRHYSDIFAEIFAENSKVFNEFIYPNVRKGYLALHSNPAAAQEMASPATPPAPPKEEAKK
jgi:type VI secretion system FHA domain protein